MNKTLPTKPPAVSWSDGRILLGTVYNIFHSEFATDVDFYAQVDRDLSAIQAANIGMVMIFPMTEWDPENQQLKWERSDYLVRRIEELGLRFVPLMLKEEQCSHYFPIWKFSEHEEIYRQHLSRGASRNSREHVDFAHPSVFPVLEEYFRAVIERYGSSPNLAFYNIWNEPHYAHESDHVVARFREWLLAKYGSLAELRRVWGDDFTSWNQVTPFLSDDWDSSMPFIDWLLFRNELNGILLGELRAMLLKYDQGHAINANPVGTTWANFSSFGAYNTDNWQFTANQDFCGISYYPDALRRDLPSQPVPLWLHNLTFSIVRSAAADKPYILTELYTNGKTGMTLGGWLDHDAVWQLAWTALANDCKGLIYWKWQPFMRGRQALGRGLCTIDGTLAPRGIAVRRLGSVLDACGDILLEARLEQSQVAVLLEMNGLLKLLEQSEDAGLRTFMYESNAGLFRTLDEANISIDFLRADMGVTADQLSRYKVVILPFQIVMRPAVAAILAGYVQNGGCLVADAMTACLDQSDFAYSMAPGAGLHSVFGTRRLDWIADDCLHPLEWSASSISPLVSMHGRCYREHLQPAAGSDVLATFSDTGTPAVVHNASGDGHAYYFGFPVGGTLHAHPESPLGGLLLDLLTHAGISQPFKWSGKSTPMIRRHRHENSTIVYFVNHGSSGVEGSIEFPDLPGGSTCTPILESGSVERASHGTAAGLRLSVSLPPRGVQVIQLGRD